MERAVAYIICSPFLQLYKTPHDIMNIDPVLNVLYGLLGNQYELNWVRGWELGVGSISIG